MTESQKLQYLFDRAAITDLMVRFAVSIDTRDWARFRSCFADRVEFDYPATIGAVTLAADSLLEISPQFFGQLDATQHLSANHLMEIDGDRAVCLSTLHAQHYLAGCPGGSVQRQIGYYRTMLERLGNWRIVRSEQKVHWNEGNEEVFLQAAARVGPGTS
ncbi:nuclear transport factor 2 family protein [Caenimonas soli]|jgi:hypothetical protein|uniref:nuclear transport factor 2 family protein n=1 Tax=Caenimonas soli TaxID=2735555 RepID=UPI0015559A65|nr:nuclear transport factor 2 family protein [Caenimonas soli]NPC55927.1 nuclear transport factor 2 family protein [Caenimonas soli]